LESRVYIREAPYVLVLTDFAYSPPKIKKNYSSDTESRRLPKITAHTQNHVIRGDRDSVIYLQPY